MIFHQKIPDIDRRGVVKGLDDIKKYGNSLHKKIADFIFQTDILIYLDVAAKVRGSGSVQLIDHKIARKEVLNKYLSEEEAAKFVQLNIARETIDTGGQRGIEGTFVHEGKHALDFAKMLSTFSTGIESKIYNPSAFQREYSAHLTSAFYLKRRGGEYAREGISLGLLFEIEGDLKVNIKGIRSRLKNNYNLSPENPGRNLNTATNPELSLKRTKFLGIF